MSLETWFQLLVACLLISLTPGAGAINTMSLSLTYGPMRTLSSIAGQQLALLLQVLIVAFGVGALVRDHHEVLVAIRILGALYLVFLGLQKFMESPHLMVQNRLDATPPAPVRLIARGFMVNMLNPKAIVFVLAFVPLFIEPALPAWSQYSVLVSTMIVIDILVMCGFALLARQIKRILRTEHSVKVLNRVFGALFVGVGILLGFSGI